MPRTVVEGRNSRSVAVPVVRWLALNTRDPMIMCASVQHRSTEVGRHPTRAVNHRSMRAQQLCWSRAGPAGALASGECWCISRAGPRGVFTCSPCFPDRPDRMIRCRCAATNTGRHFRRHRLKGGPSLKFVRPGCLRRHHCCAGNALACTGGRGRGRAIACNLIASGRREPRTARVCEYGQMAPAPRVGALLPTTVAALLGSSPCNW